MGKKLPYTPRCQIKNAIRKHIWLKSRERNAALKRDNRTCQCCSRKQSTAKGKEFKVQVHHKEGIADWETLIDQVYKYLLCDPANLETLCKECHAKEHKTVKRVNIFD